MTAPAPVTVRLAGVGLEVHSPSGPWLDRIAQRYRGFCDRGPGEIAVEYTVGEAPPRPPAWLAWTGFSAELDRTGGRVRCTGPAVVSHFDLLLQRLLPLILDDGLVLHGAALADGDRGWACIGPSGAGKSTLAALFPERSLCDELLAVRIGRHGATLHALPFWTARPGTARLEAVGLIEHGSRAVRVPLPPHEAVRRLTRQAIWPVPRSAGTVEALLRLVATVPVFALPFRPHRDVWPVLTGEAA